MKLFDNECEGCDNMTERIQIQHWEKDGTTKIDPPRKIMKPYCKHYTLHMEYVMQIDFPTGKCIHYHEFQSGG